MKLTRFIAAAALLFSVSACASVDTASRNAPADTPVVGLTDSVTIAPSFDVVELNILVPRDLRVSEANMYYPVADIVWRGDLPGDRHEQIGRIFQSGMGNTTSQLTGDQNVNVQVQVMRFHSLTEKARYTVGGVHSLKFAMTVTDATTGAVLIENRIVDASFEAYGGYKALEAERQGMTQKFRITQHLGQVIQEELTRPFSVQRGSPMALAGRRV